MEKLVDNVYGLHGEYDVDSGVGRTKVSEQQPVNSEKYNQYKRLSYEKLYSSCEGPETTLSAIVELHNVKKQFGWSGNSVTALLTILKRWLPKDNTLPDTYPQMKSIMKDLGMKANFIHACINNCVLFSVSLEKMEKTSETPTSSSELGSNSVSPSIYATQHLNNNFRTLGVAPVPPTITLVENPRVYLFDKFGKKVAIGHVVTDGTSKTCHFKSVGINEKKIYIEEVIDPNARLWDPPQGGYDTLAGFVQGGYVIWFENWLAPV